MSKKVGQLTKELDITLQELKDYASKMGIEVKSAQSSVEDVDAARLVSTINLMKGNTAGSQSASNKPKIKATPVINKDNAKARPSARPVIPKKAVVPPEKEAEAPEIKAEEKPEAEVIEKPEAAPAPEVQETEVVKPEEKTAEPTPAAAEEPAEKKQEEPVAAETAEVKIRGYP